MTTTSFLGSFSLIAAEQAEMSALLHFILIASCNFCQYVV